MSENNSSVANSDSSASIVNPLISSDFGSASSEIERYLVADSVASLTSISAASNAGGYQSFDSPSARSVASSVSSSPVPAASPPSRLPSPSPPSRLPSPSPPPSPSSPSLSPRLNPPGPDLKAYSIDIETIDDLTKDPKKEKIKKLAKNCSQGNKELCGWIMHKFGKIKNLNDKEYKITLGYEYNKTSKAKKSNKPIFGVIMRTEDSKKDEDKKKLKEIPVPKSCGDCVVPTVWRNNGEEKCFKEPQKKIKPIHFCVKPCKEYLFQIYILNERYDNLIFNGYENAQNYELLNRIGQIVKPKLFWAKELNTERNNRFFKVNELSLNLSKININFPVFSDFLDLNKGSQEKVRNLLMTPEIIEFYVENPGLVTREVKQLLIALSDCYDVAKRYTGIFCKVAIDDKKIQKYGDGGEKEACQKLLEEKKMGRFNKELNVDNGCGGGGNGMKKQRVVHNPAYDTAGSIDYKNLIEAKLAEGKILAWDDEIKRLKEQIDLKNKDSSLTIDINQCKATIKILEENKEKYNQI